MTTVPEEAVKAAQNAIRTANWEYGITDADMAKALTAALPHMPQGVGVKKLEWREDIYRKSFISDIGAVSYSVFWDDDAEWCDVPEPYDLIRGEDDGDTLGSFETANEAKAAAQADYEARILSALEPSAARELALEEGYRQGIEAAAKLIECGCKSLLHGKGECQFPGNCSLEDAAAIRALSSPDHADAGKLVEGDGWLPIESAPNNNAILVHYDDGNIELISADDNMFSWIAYTVKEDFCTKPTHWRHLPLAPASEGTSNV